MAIYASRFEPDGTSRPTVIYYVESSSTDDPELVSQYFRDPVGALDSVFPGEGFDSGDWTVHSHVVDHHRFLFGFIWGLTAVVSPDDKMITVAAVKHPAPESTE